MADRHSESAQTAVPGPQGPEEPDVRSTSPVLWELGGRKPPWLPDLELDHNATPGLASLYRRISSAPVCPHARREVQWSDMDMTQRAVVLVEGTSDQYALEALAERRGRSLDAAGISIVPIGGSKNIGRFLDRFGPRGLDVRLAGLCDDAEEDDYGRALERAGLGSDLTRPDMEALGFYVCVADLEDELIRSLGGAAVEQVINAQGDLEAFRTFQKQPAWRERSHAEQLRRFMGTRSGRKAEAAASLVHALDLTRVPRPLDRVLAHV